MEVRESGLTGRLSLVALALLAGCLDAPAGAVRSNDGDHLLPPVSEADAAPAVCDTAFAVAYVDRLTVDPAGGTYVGVLVIEALGSTVDLDQLVEGPDDGLAVELELAQPAYEITPVGLVRGMLDPAAEDMILASGLIDGEAWDGGAPTFQLRFDPVAELHPASRVVADLSISDSRVVLEFDIDYDRSQEEVAVPLAARRVESACGE